MRKSKKTKVKAIGCELAYAGKEREDSLISLTPAARLEKIKAFGGGSGRGWENMLIHGDNLPVLKALLRMKGRGKLGNSDGTPGVRLIYIDPPFSTRLKFRGKKGQAAYDDTLTGARFLEFLRERVIFLRELLSENGSIYLHLDWKKAHYVKVIMDEVFGEENFLNDIIWNYGGRGAKAVSGQFSRNHDIILCYQKTSHIFNRSYVEKRFLKGEGGFKRDGEGRWFKTSPRGDYTDESVSALLKEGRVYMTGKGNIRIKYFLREEGDRLVEDKLVGDVWDDIPDGMHLSDAEKTGYPTQKPEALLARIIKASTNPGDVVLDAFAGAGTTLAVAEKLERRWVGVDSGRLSINTIRKRLLKIDGTRDVENRKVKYSKALKPFNLYRGKPS